MCGIFGAYVPIVLIIRTQYSRDKGHTVNPIVIYNSCDYIVDNKRKGFKPEEKVVIFETGKALLTWMESKKDLI